MTALDKIRLSRGITQRELAKELNVSSTCISMWETGNRKPDIITLKKLSVILGCTTDELLEPIEVNINKNNGHATDKLMST